MYTFSILRFVEGIRNVTHYLSFSDNGWYLKLSPLEAVERISRLNAEVRKVNGTFITLWHNESLGEMRHWKNWREVYEALIKIAS